MLELLLGAAAGWSLRDFLAEETFPRTAFYFFPGSEILQPNDRVAPLSLPLGGLGLVHRLRGLLHGVEMQSAGGC
jgi:hypothetical protein